MKRRRPPVARLSVHDLLFVILSLGWFVVGPDNLWARPIIAIYALFVVTAIYVVVRMMHHGSTKRVEHR